MKKHIAILIVLLTLAFASTVTIQAETFGVPYKTYTLNANGGYVETQTAYVPVGYIGESLAFDSPEDLFVIEDILYVADTGNNRIVSMTLDGTFIDEISYEEFVEPVGIFVKDHKVYVADRGAKAVFVIDVDTKELIMKIEKPVSPIFGLDNDFVPIKVAVNSSDSIYVIGEGSTSGVIQLNYTGEFLGYLGINKVEYSLRKVLYNFIVSDSELTSSRPASPTNIAIGSKGSILTSNVNVTETFKRLNISGINTLLDGTSYPTSELSDLWMNEDGYTYLVSSSGDVYEYDSNGQLLFTFKAASYGVKQSLGLVQKPSGVVTDSQGNLYILDSGAYGFVHVYQPTAFTNLIHQAVTMYNNGEYVESKDLWTEILRLNSSFALAHSALGSALAKEGNYTMALSEFHDANNLNGYSTVFWELRNASIQKNLGLWTIILIVSILAYKIGKKVYKNSTLETKVQHKMKPLKDSIIVKELLFSLEVMKHPLDTYLSVRRMKVASLKSATIVFGAFIITYFISLYGSGYLFASRNPAQVWFALGLMLGIIGLYMIINYLISTLTDGEGRLRDIYIATAYALIPYIIFSIPLTILSHVLTYNELFIYEFYQFILVTWTALLILISIQAIHNYSFFKLIKTVFIILFGMAISIILLLLVYSFIGQFYVFVISLIREVIYRV